MIRSLTVVALCSFAATAVTQGPPPGGAPRFAKKKLVKRFDANKNGRLDGDERTKAIAWINEDKKKNPPRRRGRGGKWEPKLESYKVAKDSVSTYADKPLFDTSVIRTMFLDFKNPKRDEHMKLYYRTDIDEPATLTVDGKVYEDVGVHYRGSSSYFTVVHHPKKSLSISLDYVNRKQRIGGYKTMNLLSAHADPSFMRSVLFSHITSQYLKTTKACFVHLVINGESWGLYINDQQLNKDFVEESFGTRKGARWKIGPNFKGEAALAYQGAETKDYSSKYLKEEGLGRADRSVQAAERGHAGTARRSRSGARPTSTAAARSASYRKMIEPIIKKDDKSLYGYDAFVQAIEKGSDRRPGLRRFLEERRAFLDAHAALK